MQINSISTSSLRFPDVPTFRPLCSSLVQGPNGCFGLVVSTETMSDGKHDRVNCIFCEWNFLTMQVIEHQIILPYRCLEHIQLGYDPEQSRWVISLNARVRNIEDDPTSYSVVVGDVYEIHLEQNQTWKKLLRIAPDERTRQYRWLHAFWQQKKRFSSLVGAYYEGLTGTLFYWMPWSEPAVRQLHRLGSGVRCVPYIFDESFLLFICSCQRKRLQWQWHVAAYQTDGSRITYHRVPRIAYQSKREWSLAIYDLENWLQPTLYVGEGPYDGEKRRATCVAAILLKDQPIRALSHMGTTDSGEPTSQGGLYCIDQSGHFVARELSPLGDQVCFCLCGKKVIGVDQLGEQWQLWSWTPLNKRARKIEVLLAQNALRVTVVSIDEEEQSGKFWCIEEYKEYIVASLWKSDPVQKVDQVRIDGMILSMRSDEWSWGIRPCGIIAFRQTLLLVGINREKQIQVTQIC